MLLITGVVSICGSGVIILETLRKTLIGGAGGLSTRSTIFIVPHDNLLGFIIIHPEPPPPLNLL